VNIMATNDQILNVLTKLQEDVTDLKVATAKIPDLADRTNELVRVVKGHNGHDGLVTRIHIQESILKRHIEDFCGIQKDMQMGFSKIHKVLEDHIEKTVEENAEILREERSERRDVRKDSRKFGLDLTLAIALMIINLLATIITNVL
jgi:hypothetical protein